MNHWFRSIFPVVCGLGSAALLTATLTATASDSETDRLDIDRANFDQPLKIDNPWMPLTPGTQFIYEGTTSEEGKTTHHRIIFTVTDLVKIINRIPVRVVWDRDFSEGLLEESELTFFAQDNEGNVWHLGQYREMYDEVELVGGRAWMVGHLDGAKAGIMMTAKPTLGAPSYSQGFAPSPFNWTDRARVVKMGESTSVPAGDFDDVLVIEEFNEEEPGAIQLKYYARGVGNVRVGWSGDDENQEELELIRVVKLDAEAMKEVRRDALALDRRNYIYGDTKPIEVAPEDVAPQPALPSSAAERKISDEQAAEIAIKHVPGDVVTVAMERKLGDLRLVVEVIAADDMAETDVIIDRMTGEVLAVEK